MKLRFSKAEEDIKNQSQSTLDVAELTKLAAPHYMCIKSVRPGSKRRLWLRLQGMVDIIKRTFKDALQLAVAFKTREYICSSCSHSKKVSRS